MRPHTLAAGSLRPHTLAAGSLRPHTLAAGSLRPHTLVSPRVRAHRLRVALFLSSVSAQNVRAQRQYSYFCTRKAKQNLSTCTASRTTPASSRPARTRTSTASTCQHTSAYVSIRRSTSAYVSIRAHPHIYISIDIKHIYRYVSERYVSIYVTRTHKI